MAAETLRVQGRSGEDVTPRRAHRRRRADASTAATSWSRSGRTPNTAGIGLEEAGVELDARGYIRVNERLETSAPEVWAIGECAGSPQFTHVSVDDFRIIRDNLAGGQPQHPRSAGSLLHVHGPAARPRRTERERGAAPRRRGARRDAADERRAADADDRRDTRLHEGAGRRERRSHSRLHHDRRRGRRGHGRGADGDAGGVALSQARAMPFSRTRRWRRDWASCSRMCRLCRRHGSPRTVPR